jgi:hypothetical protein
MTKAEALSNLTIPVGWRAFRAMGASERFRQMFPGANSLRDVLSHFKRFTSRFADTPANNSVPTQGIGVKAFSTAVLKKGNEVTSVNAVSEKMLSSADGGKNEVDGWILFDHLGQVSKVNKTFLYLFGLIEADVRGCSPEEVLATISLACVLDGNFPQINYFSMAIFNKPWSHKDNGCFFRICHPKSRLIQVVRCELSSKKFRGLLLFRDVSHLSAEDLLDMQFSEDSDKDIIHETFVMEDHSIYPAMEGQNKALNEAYAIGNSKAFRSYWDRIQHG